MDDRPWKLARRPQSSHALGHSASTHGRTYSLCYTVLELISSRGRAFLSLGTCHSDGVEEPRRNYVLDGVVGRIKRCSSHYPEHLNGLIRRQILQMFSGYADAVRVSPVQHDRCPRKRHGRRESVMQWWRQVSAVARRAAPRTAKKSSHLEEIGKQQQVFAAQPSETTGPADILMPDFPVSRTGKEQTCFLGKTCFLGQSGKGMGKLRTRSATTWKS